MGGGGGLIKHNSTTFIILKISTAEKMAQQQKKEDTTARDVSRKLKQNKLVDELQILGVKQCYVYTSTCMHWGVVRVRMAMKSLPPCFKASLGGYNQRMSSSDDEIKETYILPKLPSYSS